MNIELIHNPPTLENEDYRLLPLGHEQKHLVHLIVSNEKIRKRIHMDVLDSPELFEPWWKARMDALKQAKLMHWLVFLKKSNAFCGLLTLKEIDSSSHRGEIGYSFLPEYWGRGIASSSIKMLFHFAMNDLKLHSLFAQVLDSNMASQKILTNLGFKKEGHFNDCYFHKGVYYDILQFGYINPK